MQKYLAEPDVTRMVFDVVRAQTLSEALEQLSSWRFDAILADLMLPDSSGLETFQVLQRKASGVAILVTTSVGDERAAMEAMRSGAQDFILKGSPDFRMLKRAIRYAVERKAALEQRDQVIRAAADGMVVIDATGIVRLVNPAAERMFLPASLLGRSFPYPIRLDETGIIEIPRPPQPPTLVEMRVSPMSWNLEPASLACLRDVGEVRRFDEMKTEVAQRRHADRMKDEWVAKISHELRTPLTIIKGAVTELAEGAAAPLRPDQMTLVGMAQHQVKRVERLILSLLELSRLESGATPLVRGRLDPAEVVHMTVSALQHAAAQRAVILTSQVTQSVGPIDADADLFEQLVMNLVDNALRFARSRVRVRLARGTPSGIELSVEDDGIGIPADKQGLLFSKYAQIDRPRGPEGYKGTGLGLAICKEIVALHHGVIKVESAPGRGTAFHVLLPELAEEPSEAGRPEPAHAAGGSL
ncbi:MAG: hypothetical protein A2506_09235 [Elusimicrobia bacterium RIFOXYD12_FULL_66_9]|nr:MAG: hypothetical protein A2506_09235 [Elusimicrobia bacterium RIFOXYD12_FULL_66_9]